MRDIRLFELLLTLKTLHITHMIHYHNRKDPQVDGLLKENLKKEELHRQIMNQISSFVRSLRYDCDTTN
ncbi:unnamed protein product [Rhizophagus irregularis]|nr:unnamed protein product [Rhizophagus irregularis]